MNTSKKFVMPVLVGMALVLVMIMAFRDGYTVGSDIAQRENEAEAR